MRMRKQGRAEKEEKESKKEENNTRKHLTQHKNRAKKKKKKNHTRVTKNQDICPPWLIKGEEGDILLLNDEEKESAIPGEEDGLS